MKKILTFALLATLSTQAQAFMPSGTYVKANIGATNGKNDTGVAFVGGVGTGNGENDHGAELTYGAAIGMEIFPQVRAELEGRYYAAETDNTTSYSLVGAPVATERNIDVYEFFLNGYYDINLNLPVPLVPYVTAGVGAIRVEFDGVGAGDHDTELASQVGLGATYAITDRIAADIAYKYAFTYSDFEVTPTNAPFLGEEDWDYGQHNVLAGVSYKF